jgi:hypothetical protein
MTSQVLNLIASLQVCSLRPANKLPLSGMKNARAANQGRLGHFKPDIKCRKSVEIY